MTHGKESPDSEENQSSYDYKSNSPFSQEIPELLERHYRQLKHSGISDDVIKERGYRSVLGRKELAESGFSKAQRLTPTLLIQIWTVEGNKAFSIHRPDNPRKGQNSKEIKYENPSGKGLRIDAPPRCRESLKNHSIRLWITEGVKKADALVSRGECAIDLLGVYGFKHKNEFGATTISADLDYIAWQGRVVYICFDNDVMVKPEVKRALELFTEHLRRKGAIVYHIYLPLGNGKKVGVDDFLFDHSTDELLSYAVKQEEGAKDADVTPQYFFDNSGYLCRSKLLQGASIPIRLANFDARINEELILDNGLEISHTYKIEATKKDKHLCTVEVTAPSFSGMTWTHKLGYDAIIEPGANMKDYVRHYIQTRSTPKLVMTYTHTGWRKEEDEWIYLFSGGAIGKEDVSVALSQELHRYRLPQIPENESDAIRTSLGFLEIGKREITSPLLTYLYLSPLTTLISPMPNFSLYTYGMTGVFKTSLAILLLSHFGDFACISDLSNFEDSANSLGKRAFTLKDTLMLFDDYHPSIQRHMSQQREALAQRLIREFSNPTERGRLNSDTTEKPRYSPRGMLLITGEDLISLQSSLARVCVVEIGEGDIIKIRLTELQRKSYVLHHAMSSYIHWMRNEGIENIQETFKEAFSNLREKASSDNLHAKLPEQVAFLQFSLSNVLNWLLDKKVITDERARELKDEGWTIFKKLATENERRIKSEDLVNKFIDILNSLLFQQKVRIEEKEYATKFLGGDEGKADFIGFYDDSCFYLLPTPLWNAVQKYCNSSNEFFPMSKPTLYRMLEKRKLIDSRDGRHTIPFKHRGQVHKVLKFFRKGISAEEVTEVTYAENDI